MASLDAELHRAVGPVRTRLLLQHYGRWALYAMASGAAAAAAVFLAGSFLPKYEANRTAVLAAAGVALLWLAIAAWRQPRLSEIARRADAAGLSERLQTCLEYAGQESALLSALRADTVNALQAANWSKRLPWRLPRGALYATAACLLTIVMLHAFPNPLLQRMLRLQAERDAIAAEVKRLDAAVRLAEAEAEKLPNAREAAALLEQLRDELKSARTTREALQALGKAEERLEQLQQPEEAELAAKLQETGQGLMQSPETRSLGEALARSDWEEARRQLEQLAANVQNQSPEERQQTAEALERASNALQQAEQQVGGERASLSGDLAEAARALTEGETQTASQALREAGEAVVAQGQAHDQAGQQAEAIAAALAGLAASREAMVAAGSGQQGQDRGDGLAALPGDGSQGEQGEGAIPGSPGGGREGQGLMLGSSVGGQEGNEGGEGGLVGSDIGGGGAGRQDSGVATTVGEVGAAGQSGTDGGPNSRRDFSQVFDPTPRLGGEGQGSLLQGEAAGEGGATQFQSPEARVAAGDFRPYDQVFAKYEEQAIQSMQRVEMPPGVQQLVKSYFSALDPANQGSGGTR